MYERTGCDGAACRKIRSLSCSMPSPWTSTTRQSFSTRAHRLLTSPAISTLVQNGTSSFPIRSARGCARSREMLTGGSRASALEFQEESVHGNTFLGKCFWLIFLLRSTLVLTFEISRFRRMFFDECAGTRIPACQHAH